MKINKKHVFSAILLITFMFLAYSLFVRLSFVADSMISIGFFIVLYYYDRRKKFSVGAISLVALAIFLHLAGDVGLYSHFLIKDVIGYDKLVHFTGGFAVAYIISQMITEKQKFLHYSFAILIVLGLGSLLEVNEFIGQTYFGVENGGIFDTGDGLPTFNSDLQRYDTYFDMMFNLAGALTSVIFMMLLIKIRAAKAVL